MRAPSGVYLAGSQRVLINLPIFHYDQEILGRIGDEIDVLQRITVD